MRDVSILMTMIVLGLTLARGSAYAQSICAQPSHPASRQDVACRAGINEDRCFAGPTQEECDTDNWRAYEKGLITLQAHNWLYDNYRCALLVGDRVQAICPPGCFAADTLIATVGADGATQEKPAHSIGREDTVSALMFESNLSAPQLESLPVAEVVAGPESIPLYVFRLSNGRTLRVTEHHGMVLSDGRVVRAREVQPDARFLSSNGSSVAVRAIEREKALQPVVNFRIDTEEVQEHVVVAEGVLVGDLFLQNELGREQASIQLRK